MRCSSLKISKIFMQMPADRPVVGEGSEIAVNSGMGTPLRRIFLVLAGLWAGLSHLHAQYELDEMSVHAGAGLGVVLHSYQAGLGPAVNADFAFTHWPCGKAFAIQGNAGVVLGQTRWEDGQPLLGVFDAGATRVGWAVGALGASIKVRLQDFHRPREVALVVGPRLWVPVYMRAATAQGKGGLAATTDAKPHPFLVGGNLGVQFRRPAPDKKSWFIEPGLFWSPVSLIDGALDARTVPVYLYLNFGFAFWDERG